MFNVSGIIGNFSHGERVVVSNNTLSMAAIATSGTNTMVVGESLFQPSSGALSASVANGVVVFANTTLVLLANVQGVFTTSGSAKGSSSNYLITPTTASQNVYTVAGSNTIKIGRAHV